jgi:hypothetical protein
MQVTHPGPTLRAPPCSFLQLPFPCGPLSVSSCALPIPCHTVKDNGRPIPIHTVSLLPIPVSQILNLKAPLHHLPTPVVSTEASAHTHRAVLRSPLRRLSRMALDRTYVRVTVCALTHTQAQVCALTHTCTHTLAFHKPAPLRK